MPLYIFLAVTATMILVGHVYRRKEFKNDLKEGRDVQDRLDAMEKLAMEYEKTGDEREQKEAVRIRARMVAIRERRSYVLGVFEKNTRG